MLPKFLKVLLGLFILLSITIALISIEHPIILKWITGTARCLGRPIESTVYQNGKRTNSKTYIGSGKWQGNELHYYILCSFDSLSKDSHPNGVLGIHDKKGYKWVGVPNNGKKDYDILFGSLFQSESASFFVSFSDGAKGWNFNPELTISNNLITFKTPKNIKGFNCDSIRIELK